MAGNTFGQIFRLTTFGESHGPALGGILDGCPAGLTIDLRAIQDELDRRRPGQSDITTARKEADEFELLSGVFDGRTTGAPIGFLIRNRDERSSDYDAMADSFRPSHADFTYTAKYGLRDHRGGGRSSARETVARVLAGSIARQLLAMVGVEVGAFVSGVGPFQLPVSDQFYSREEVDANPVRCPDPFVANDMIRYISQLKEEGDTTGGLITGQVRGMQAGWGEPVFDKLHADLGKAMLSINAVHGFEYGSGFGATAQRGSEHNDTFTTDESGRIITRTNHSGGIQGGISNGMDIRFRVAFKPVATLLRPQSTVDRSGSPVTLAAKGRHDPCVVPRAVPIVEAMTCLVLADHLLRQRAARI
jgi:chorismate synthase